MDEDDDSEGEEVDIRALVGKGKKDKKDKKDNEPPAKKQRKA